SPDRAGRSPRANDRGVGGSPACRSLDRSARIRAPPLRPEGGRCPRRRSALDNRRRPTSVPRQYRARHRRPCPKWSERLWSRAYSALRQPARRDPRLPRLGGWSRRCLRFREKTQQQPREGFRLLLMAGKPGERNQLQALGAANAVEELLCPGRGPVLVLAAP